MQRHRLEIHAIGELMRQLPSAHEPPMGWNEFQRQAAAAHRARQPARPALGWRHAALAAGIAVAVAGLALWARLSPTGPTSSGLEEASSLPAATARAGFAFSQAEASERWLSRLPVEPAVMRLGTRAAVTSLEDRIAWMDDVLSAQRVDAIDPAYVVALQHERARLMNSLAQVRYAETLVAAAQ